MNDGQQSVSKAVTVPIVGADAAVTDTYPISDTSFSYGRGIAMDENGNLIFTVMRPDNLQNPSSLVVSLVTLNDSDPVDVYTRDINSGSYYTEDIAVDSAGQTYVINTSTSPAAPFGAVEIYDGDTFIEERQLPGTPIGLVEAPSGDVYAVVAVYAEQPDGSVQRVVSVYDVTNDEDLGVAYISPAAGQEDIEDAAVGLDGRIYVTNPSDGTVAVVGEQNPINVGGTPVGIAVDPDDGRVYAIVTRQASPAGPGHGDVGRD